VKVIQEVYNSVSLPIPSRFYILVGYYFDIQNEYFVPEKPFKNKSSILSIITCLENDL